MFKKQIIIIFIIIVLGSGLWVTVYEVQKHWELESFSISITQDEDFLSLGLEGEGTETNPFVNFALYSTFFCQ